MQADVTAQWTRRLLIGAGALLVVPLLPMLVAAFATFPLGDDFSRSNDAHFLFDLPKAVEFVVFEWIHWSGRYSHTFSIIFFADSVRWPWVHGLLILSFIGVFFVAARGIFLCLVNEPVASWWLALLATLGLFAAHETLDRNLYFFTDSVGLGAGSLALLVFLWRLLVLWTANVAMASQVRWAMAAGVVAVGYYEHSLLATLLSAGVAFVAARWTRHARKPDFFRVLRAVLIAAAVALGAPGNFKRQVVRPVDWRDQLAQVPSEYLRWVPEVLSCRFMLVALLLAFAASAWRPAARERRLALPFAFATLALSVAVIFLHAFTDASMDSNPKLPANLHFMLGIGLTATFVAAWPKRLSLSRSASVVLVTLLAVPSLALAPRVTLVARQVLSGNIAAYRDAMESREAVIRQTQSGTVRVAPVANCPYPACIEEAVRDDPGVWPSDKIARYYGVPVLTAAPDPVLLEAGWGRERDAIVRRGLALALLQPGPSATFKEWWLLLDSPSAGPVGVTFHRDHSPLATPKTELSVIRLEGGGGAVRPGLGPSEVGTLTVELGGRTEVLRVPPVSR